VDNSLTFLSQRKKSGKKKFHNWLKADSRPQSRFPTLNYSDFSPDHNTSLDTIYKNKMPPTDSQTPEIKL
jgi:hypothetical protein